MGHESERRVVFSMVLVPGRANLADPDTKSDSPLKEALQLTLHNGRLQLDFSLAESKTDDNPLH